MRLSDLKFCRPGLLAAGTVFIVALAAPVHLPVPGDLSIENAAQARPRRAKAMSQQESGCDATCLNNQQLQGMSSGGMSGGGMSGGGMSGGGMSGSTMSGHHNVAPGSMSGTGSRYRGGTGGQPRSEAETAARGARITR